MSGTERLYTPELLSLAVHLAEYPWREDSPRTGDARSKSCGSTLSMGLETDLDGKISQLGMRVHACAVGQASAAIFAKEAAGRDKADIERTLEQMTGWLNGEGPVPEWPGIDAIDAARAYPARHGAMLLPWQAALAALSSTETSV